MSTTIRHCPYCANAGCVICHEARMDDVALESVKAEASDFFRRFLVEQGVDPNTKLDTNTHILIAAAIEFGKETVRGQRMVDDACEPLLSLDRFAMLEFERVTLIPQRADVDSPSWMRDKRKPKILAE